MKINKLVIIILSILILINLSINIYQLFENKSQKIGYVLSPKVIYEFIGTKDIQNKYNEKLQLWNAQLDTLKREYNLSMQKYKTSYKTLTEEEKEEMHKLLKHKEVNILKYQKNIEENAANEEEKLMSGVLTQINSFISNYGRKNNFTIIFGSTSEGNILYGKDAINITDEVLFELNKNYTGD